MGIGITAIQFDLYKFEFFLYDLAFKALPDAPISQELTVVEYDKSSKEKFGVAIQLDDLSTVIDNIAKQKPTAILLFLAIDHTNLNVAQVSRFNESTKNIKNIFWSYEDGPFDGRNSIAYLASKITNVKFKTSGYTRDIHSYAADSVSRRWLVDIDGENSRADLPAFLEAGDKGRYKIATNREYLTNGHRSIFIRPRRASSTQKISFSAAHSNTLSPQDFDGKFVIVGRAIGDWASDYTKSSLENTPNTYSKLDHLTSATNTVLLNDPVLRFDTKPLPLFLAVFFTFILLILIFHFSPAWGIPILIFTLSLFLMITLGMLHFFQIWLPITHSIVALLFTYFVVLPFKLIHDSRRLLRQQNHNFALARSIEVSRLSAKNILADREYKMALQVAHDIRAPITALTALEGVLRDKVEPQLIDLLKATTSRINRIADDLLSANRTKSKSLSDQRVVDIRHLLSDLLDSYRIAWKNCTFTFECSEPSVNATLESTKLERAISNLINNAIEAHPTKTSTINIRLSRQDQNIVIEITDNGMGIPPSLQNKLFQEGTSLGKTKGSGLGLSQAKGVFTELGGDLILKKSSDQGTTFQGYFPLNKTNSTKLIRLKRRVIIADDSAEARSVMKDLLIKAEIEVVECKTTQECELAIQQQPDKNFSLFTDLVFMNEEKNGFDLLQLAAKVTGASEHHCLCSTIANAPEIAEASSKLHVQLISKDQLSSLSIQVIA